MGKVNYTKMEIPMAVSIINMRLRDLYRSFDEFCEREELIKEALLKYFDEHGYYYDKTGNQLREKQGNI